MAIQFNDITAIGDVFEIHTNTPIIGVQSISGFTDSVLNETVGRYFYREFRYSLNGITYSDWVELTNQNLIDTFVGQTSIFDIQYRYTRSGTDITGFLTFISIQLEGVVEEQQNPKIFTDLYFNKFFNYNDDSVLKWALNVLDKLHKRGIVANYMSRGEEGINDDDYLALFGSLTHFMAILVRYAREFKDFTLNSILLNEYLKQKGVFVNDGISLENLQTLLSKLYVNFLERGTNEITKEIGTEGRVTDGELVRLLRKSETDELVWGLNEPEKTIWNINNNSPMYRGVKQALNLIKAYELTQDVVNLSSYPLLEPSFVSLYTDGDKDVLRVLNSTSSNISGIGGALANSNLILIDTRLSYEITFYVKQSVLSNSFSLKVFLYDEEENLILDSPLNAVTGGQTNIAIDKQQLLKNDTYYLCRVILFNERIGTDPLYVPDIGFGNHLILVNSNAKYMSIDVGTEINDGNNDLRIWDFKVRPLMTKIANGFLMVSSIITSFIDNNSEEDNVNIYNKIRRYLVPYNSIVNNQFLDDLFVPAGIPLSITVTKEDETVLGAVNGKIVIVATGGRPPYQFSIDNGTTFQSSNTFTNLSPGVYNILVEDEDGTQVTDTITILEGADSLTLELFGLDELRPMDNDGQITAIGHSGVAPYYYSIDGINYSTNGIFPGLDSGTYTIYLADSGGNTRQGDITIGIVRSNQLIIDVANSGRDSINSAVFMNYQPTPPTTVLSGDTDVLGGDVTIYVVGINNSRSISEITTTYNSSTMPYIDGVSNGDQVEIYNYTSNGANTFTMYFEDEQPGFHVSIANTDTGFRYKFPNANTNILSSSGYNGSTRRGRVDIPVNSSVKQFRINLEEVLPLAVIPSDNPFSSGGERFNGRAPLNLQTNVTVLDSGNNVIDVKQTANFENTPLFDGAAPIYLPIQPFDETYTIIVGSVGGYNPVDRTSSFPSYPYPIIVFVPANTTPRISTGVSGSQFWGDFVQMI